MSAIAVNAHMSAPDIEISLNDPEWSRALADLDIAALGQRAIRAAMVENVHPSFGEISLAFVSDAQMQALNANYRGKDSPTNVLSFSAMNTDTNLAARAQIQMLGDIVLARQTITAEAKAASITLADHLAHLIIHGFFHLCGYDHETDTEAAQMEALEVRALNRLAIRNPYDTDNVL